ncbi:MAG: ZIP family metal transporter [Adlercreutzia equolifaciens]
METLSPFAFVTLVTLISGAGGTGLGGFIGALFKSESNRTISLLLAFAGGVMTAMVCFDLLAEAEEAASQIAEHGVVLVIFAVALGVAVVYLLNHLIDRKTRKEVSHTADEHHPETHDDIDELVHADHLNMHKRHNDSRLSLFVAGVVMACAIALHNIPEGMTIGASFAVSDNLMWGTGMIMAVLIGLHNIPEGMAVAVPLISGGTGRVKATLLTAACGLPTVLGAWLGFARRHRPLGLTMSLGFASGAMLYVVFGEIMPESYLIYRSKLPPSPSW